PTRSGAPPLPTQDAVAGATRASRTETLVGTVRDADGNVVEHSVVAIEPASSGWCASRLQMFQVAGRLVKASELRLPSRPGEPTTTTTDARGHFELPIPDARSVNVGAFHAESGLAVQPGLVLDLDAPTTRVDLVLEPGLILAGRVADEDEHPLTGARLMILG